jgi:tetratricopeptide (TPR) repeat protein
MADTSTHSAASTGGPGRAALTVLAVVIAVAMMLLGWLIVRNAMVDQLVSSNPEAALRIDPRNARALVAAAELDMAAKPARLDQAEAQLKLAAEVAPLEAEVFSDLAQIASARGDSARADKLFTLAAQRSRRVLAPEIWRLNRAAMTKDYDTAWNALDAILRTQPGDVGAAVIQSVAGLASTPAAQASLVRLLASKPPWRTGFLTALSQSSSTIEVPVRLLALLEHTAAPPSDDEVRAVTQGLIALGDYPRAFNGWVQLLPAKRLGALGNIYNGRFASDGGDVAFNWTVAPDAQGLASLGAGEDGTGLRATPVDRAAPFVRELLVLPEGRYDLKGKVRVADATSPQDEGLVWSLRCAEGGQVVARSNPLKAADGWSSFSFGFVVPPSRCQGQWLELTRPGSLASSDGAPVWFNEFSISPHSGGAG